MIDNPFLLEDSAVRSLNRARIVELGGVAAPEGVLGATGYELLSAASLGQQIAAAADRLGLDPAQPDLIRRFDACFGHSQARPHALAIARDAYGEGHEEVRRAAVTKFMALSMQRRLDEARDVERLYGLDTSPPSE